LIKFFFCNVIVEFCNVRKWQKSFNICLTKYIIPLFLYIEQGLGDTIQFYRFAALLLARGAKVILSAQDRLLRLLKSADPAVQLVGSNVVPADE